MEQVNMEDVSYVELNKKIDDMKKIRESLFREINQNQLNAQNLRDTITAYNQKIEDLKKQIGQYDTLVMKRHEEVAQLDSKNTEEMRLIEAHKRDLITLRETVNNEQTLFQKEKVAILESIDNERKKNARREMELNTREQNLKDGERQVSGQLKDTSQRKIDVEAREKNVSKVQDEAEKARGGAELTFKQAEKALDEANAMKSRYESLSSETKAKEQGFVEDEARIRTAHNELEARKLELDNKFRDLTIEEDRVRQIKDKLRKEIHYSMVTKEKKEDFKKELGPE